MADGNGRSNATARQGGHALITGASSGLGLRFAKLFARDGYQLTLVALEAEALDRVAQKLRNKYGATVQTVALDLTEADAPERLYQTVQDIPVDVLVNNAGFGTYGEFSKAEIERELALIQIHVLAITKLTHRFLRDMKARNQGRILNVSSMSAFQPCPMMAVYAAVKTYVLSFTEALATEVAGTGVSVTALCPGPVPSGFQQASDMNPSRFGRLFLVDAERVAREGYEGLMKGQPIVIPGKRNRLMYHVVRLSPRWAVAQVAKGFMTPYSKS